MWRFHGPWPPPNPAPELDEPRLPPAPPRPPFPPRKVQGPPKDRQTDLLNLFFAWMGMGS